MTDTWKHVASAGRAGAMSARVLTPDEQDHVADCLDAAAEWHVGRLPWQEAASIGGWHESPDRTRFLAVTTTPITDPRWAALRALLDVLVDASGLVRTTQGVFTRATLGEHNVIVHMPMREDGAA